MQFMVAIFRRPAAAPRARRLRLGLALVGLRWLAAAVVAGQALGHEAAAGDAAIRKLVGQAVDLRAGERRDLVLDDRGRLRLARGAGGHVAEGEFVSTASPLAAAPGWRLVWTEQWTAPQRWQKHSANPVYTPAMTGWSGLVNGVSIVPLADGRTYRMYYAGARGQGIGFAEASVADPVRWQDHGREVLTPRPGTWEGDRRTAPATHARHRRSGHTQTRTGLGSAPAHSLHRRTRSAPRPLGEGGPGHTGSRETKSQSDQQDRAHLKRRTHVARLPEFRANSQLRHSSRLFPTRPEKQASPAAELFVLRRAAFWRKTLPRSAG